MHCRARHSVFLVYALASWVSITACTTSKSAMRPEAASRLQDDAKSRAKLKAAHAQQMYGQECPPPERNCPLEHNPTMCTARSYNEQALGESEQLVSWGSNPCLAKAQLALDACQKQWTPSFLASVDCVPDASDGVCPPEPVVCTAEHAPSSCQAEAYDGQKLAANALPAARATNACRALSELHLAACRRNLNPKLLQRIVCQNVGQL